jgi:hypothetical protein
VYRGGRIKANSNIVSVFASGIDFHWLVTMIDRVTGVTGARMGTLIETTHHCCLLVKVHFELINYTNY